jgi:hypothetical protein
LVFAIVAIVVGEDGEAYGVVDVVKLLLAVQ